MAVGSHRCRGYGKGERPTRVRDLPRAIRTPSSPIRRTTMNVRRRCGPTLTPSRCVSRSRRLDPGAALLRSRNAGRARGAGTKGVPAGPRSGGSVCCECGRRALLCIPRAATSEPLTPLSRGEHAHRVYLRPDRSHFRKVDRNSTHSTGIPRPERSGGHGCSVSRQAYRGPRTVCKDTSQGRARQALVRVARGTTGKAEGSFRREHA